MEEKLRELADQIGAMRIANEATMCALKQLVGEKNLQIADQAKRIVELEKRLGISGLDY